MESIKRLKIRRFVNYRNLCFFMSQLAHDYDRRGYDKFMQTEYKCRGIYKRYLLAYRDYLTHKETGRAIPSRKYKGKFILEPHLHMGYFKFKDKTILDNIEDEMVPEMFNYGFMFTSVQESVQSIVKGDRTYEEGF